MLSALPSLWIDVYVVNVAINVDYRVCCQLKSLWITVCVVNVAIIMGYHVC